MIDSRLVIYNRSRCFGYLHRCLEKLQFSNEIIWSVILTSSAYSTRDIIDDFETLISKLESKLDCSIEYFVVYAFIDGVEHLHCLLLCPFLHKEIVDNFWVLIHHAYSKQCLLFCFDNDGVYRYPQYVSRNQSGWCYSFTSPGWSHKIGD